MVSELEKVFPKHLYTSGENPVYPPLSLYIFMTLHKWCRSSKGLLLNFLHLLAKILCKRISLSIYIGLYINGGGARKGFSKNLYTSGENPV